MPGASYELAFALYLLDWRIGTRRSIVAYDALMAADGKETPYRFFRATYRSESEAMSHYALASSRSQFAAGLAAHGGGDACPDLP